MEKRFEGLDSIRVMAAMGIILRHVQANMSYSSLIGENIFVFFNSFVGLFMIVSSFSMCCGYYEKIVGGGYSIEKFYLRRFKKVWPFFAFLVCVDVIVAPSKNAIYEAFANLTLMFGLLPNANINVIGVGWTLGVIFVFYLMFPFFCFLFQNKKRAWLTLAISVLLRIVCSNYFFSADFVVEQFARQSNFLYNAVFFVVGGLLFLYRDSIICLFSSHKKIAFWGLIVLGICSVWSQQWESAALTFVIGILFFTMWIMYAISCPGKISRNSIVRKLSSVSLEIYLSHMFIFRVLELAGITTIIKTYPTINYLITTLMVMVCTILFSVVADYILTNVLTKKCK